MPQVVIVGGGISGLSAAYFLEQRARQAGLELSIQLLEQRERLGGVILTERDSGFLLEGGPDSFLSVKPAAIELCRELGLAEQLIPSNDHQRKTYIWHSGKLRELPDGMMFVVPTKVWPIFRSDLLSFSGKLRLAMSPLLAPSQAPKADLSVKEFISSRFGNQVLERLAEPLLAAVYGADVDSLSARAALPQLLALEEKYGSLWRGIQQARRSAKVRRELPPGGSLFVTLRHGLGELTSELQRRLVQTQVSVGVQVNSISRSPHGHYRIEWSGGQTEADAVILATPAHGAAGLLRELDPTLAGKLAEIVYHSSLIVALGYSRSTFQRELNGFGFLVPRSQGKQLIACSWISTKFPFRSAPEQVLLRCFLGGARNPSLVEEQDSRILSVTLSELQEIMGVRAEPCFARIYRWERCMPQYGVAHPSRLEEISSRLAAHPGLFLSGNGYRGVGIPDCIQSSSMATAAAIQYLQSHDFSCRVD
ncbi:MAG: protoporphyrinogen oxidase [Acidobacteria bacterium]|nr:protoporphyrinogen oxidase [Acidobacteriota bacterium]